LQFFLFLLSGKGSIGRTFCTLGKRFKSQVPVDKCLVFTRNR
jgi:hypothetical protein